MENSNNSSFQNEEKYKLHISYIGTSFSGFQSQGDNSAIQDQLKKAFETYLRHPLTVYGASRTDAGVHAEKQVVMIKTRRTFDDRKWKRGFNALLPNDIRVRSIEKTKGDFHPIKHAHSKIYRYNLWMGDCDHPVIAPFVWPLYKTIDPQKLFKEAQDFIGRHDFSSFCNKGSFTATKERTILEIYVETKGPLISIYIHGTGFLKQMIRIMVGTLVAIEHGKLPRGSIKTLLNEKNRDHSGITAKAKGLSLLEIFYDEKEVLSCYEVAKKASSGFGFNI